MMGSLYAGFYELIAKRLIPTRANGPNYIQFNNGTLEGLRKQKIMS